MTTRLNYDLGQIRANILDAQRNLGIAWGIRNGDNFAETMMDVVNDLTLALEALDEVCRQVPKDEPEGSPHGGGNLDSADIRGMVAATQGRTVDS